VLPTLSRTWISLSNPAVHSVTWLPSLDICYSLSLCYRRFGTTYRCHFQRSKYNYFPQEISSFLADASKSEYQTLDFICVWYLAVNINISYDLKWMWVRNFRGVLLGPCHSICLEGLGEFVNNFDRAPTTQGWITLFHELCFLTTQWFLCEIVLLFSWENPVLVL
jgi:hypothetical protein